ncbi:Glucanosyltransferase-domain-containing protein [Podospora didyma]|uniref:1,3-beta-glucanosyltransferase n=1 Tax=Podospora didyma TaxID=330526 RepID=A0AAE0NU78_9PEZI|nr:Glucanosyltransferase-domain-containing protein [Podospora didyma]
MSRISLNTTQLIFLLQIQSALLTLGVSFAAAVPVLDAVDNYFVNNKTGNRFQIVGVAYQPGGEAGYKPAQKLDPLSNKDNCLRDAALLQIMGVNTIRVYNLDPNLNHDECASIFNAAGMYMLIDVNSPLVGEALTSFNPWESYYAAYLNRTFAVVEAFKNYPNTLAFFSGNEVMNNPNTAKDVPPYSRAVTRDLKTYVAKHSTRHIPVGYSAADVREILSDSFNFFQCAEQGETNDMSRVDIFALNSYSWCGNSSFHDSGYETLVKDFTGSSVPVFYSEYGCNKVSPRVFTEVPTIYSSNMTGVFSGGVVYQYTQEDNNFGLVNISSNGSIALLPDFVTLRNQFAKLNFTQIQSDKRPSGPAPKPPVCNSNLITGMAFNSNFTLPVLPPNASEIIEKGVTLPSVPKIVSISDFTVKYTVTNVDGSIIPDLAVKKLADDQFNSRTSLLSYLSCLKHKNGHTFL